MWVPQMRMLESNPHVTALGGGAFGGDRSGPEDGARGGISVKTPQRGPLSHMWHSKKASRVCLQPGGGLFPGTTRPAPDHGLPASRLRETSSAVPAPGLSYSFTAVQAACRRALLAFLAWQEQPLQRSPRPPAPLWPDQPCGGPPGPRPLCASAHPHSVSLASPVASEASAFVPQSFPSAVSPVRASSGPQPHQGYSERPGDPDLGLSETTGPRARSPVGEGHQDQRGGSSAQSQSPGARLGQGFGLAPRQPGDPSTRAPHSGQSQGLREGWRGSPLNFCPAFSPAGPGGGC